MTGLKLESPTGFLQRALQRSIDLVSFGLQSAAQAQLESLSLPNSVGQVTPAATEKMEIPAAREAFQEWVLGNGLRDCVDALGPTLEWARKVCYFSARAQSVSLRGDGRLSLTTQLSGEAWNTDIVRGAKKFDRLPLPEKLAFLENEFGFGRPSLSEHVLSINAARNCLTHRGGVVGPPDLRVPQDAGLVVKWRRLVIRVRGPSGQRILELPGRVKAGEQIKPDVADVERTFTLGSKVSFSTNDYVDLSTTFLLFAVEIEQAIRGLQEGRRREATGMVDESETTTGGHV